MVIFCIFSLLFSATIGAVGNIPDHLSSKKCSVHPKKLFTAIALTEKKVAIYDENYVEIVSWDCAQLIDHLEWSCDGYHLFVADQIFDRLGGLVMVADYEAWKDLNALE